MATPADAVRILNEALAAEPDAVDRIFARQAAPAGKLVDHPTIQVGRNTLSALGIINGIFGVDERGWGFIAAEIEQETGRIIRFCETPKRELRSIGGRVEETNPRTYPVTE